MSVLVVGYPYIRESYLNTFKFYPEENGVTFLLPKKWKVKGGKVVYYPPKAKNIFTAIAYFHHSKYPIIGGLLKGWMPSFAVFLLFRRREHNIKIVFSPTEPVLLTTLYQALWSKILGLKHIVFTWENVPYEEKFKGWRGLVQRAVLRLNLTLSDGVVCGNIKAEAIIKQFTQKPTAVIPLSGLDVNFFQHSEVESMGFKNRYSIRDKIVFSFVGALDYRKGVHIILRAFPRVLEQIPHAHLILAGTGEYENDLDKLIRQFDLNNFTTRLPWVSHSELRPLLSASDIFLYPSIPHAGWEEQFGYSMAEALLMKTPVISTDSGSINQVVINEKSGFLIPPNNPVALADAMVKLAHDPELRQRMGEYGRWYITGNFSYQNVAKNFFTFFKSILGTQPL